MARFEAYRQCLHCEHLCASRTGALVYCKRFDYTMAAGERFDHHNCIGWSYGMPRGSDNVIAKKYEEPRD